MINFARIASDTFLLAWNVTSVVTFLVPLFAFSVARLTTEQEYDENGNQNQDYNENQYSNQYQNPNNYDQYGNYVGPQHWWEFWKRNRGGEYEQEDGRNDEERGAPWWCELSSFVIFKRGYTLFVLWRR